MANGTPDNGTARRIVDAMLREYDVLRAEINLYHQQQNQSLNFAMFGMFAVASAFYALLDSEFPNKDLFWRVLMLGFSLFVMINGIAFADRSLRIKRIARYLHNYLRPKLIGLLGGREVWHWELFKQASHTAAKARGYVLPLTLDLFRMAFFWLATAASLGLYVQQSVAERAFGFTLLEIILISLNIVAFVVFLSASLGIQETTGAPSDASLNEQIDRLSAQQIENGEAK